MIAITSGLFIIIKININELNKKTPQKQYVTEWAVKTHLENICTLFGDMKCNVNKNNYLLQILVNVTGLHKSSLVQFRKKDNVS